MRTAHDPVRSSPRRLAPALLAALAALAAVLAGTGCDGCRRSSRPYTPYTLGDGPLGDESPAESASPTIAASASGTVDAGKSADAGPPFETVAGVAAPGDGKSWPLGAETEVVAAPTGRTFFTGLVLDLDGDGKPDLLAFARAPDGLRGEILFAPGSAPGTARTVAAIPAGLSAAGCSARAALAQVGPRTLTFDFEPRCPARIRDQATRWIAVFRTSGQAPEIGFELRVAALPEAEAIRVAFDTRDRDGDGREDLTVTLSLTGGLHPMPAAPPVSATLAFLDRPAGLSRDPAEPEASLVAAASAMVTSARRKASAAEAAASARALRRLRQVLCEEDGGPRISTGAGTVPCGDTRSLDDALYAEALAALTLRDPARAIGAEVSIPEGPRRKELDRLLGKLAPDVAASIAHRVVAIPSDAPLPAATAGSPPASRFRWSPLAFEASGDLLVRIAGGVVRVDHESFAEAQGADVPPWPTFPASGAGGDAAGWRLLSVDQTCRAPTLTARLQPSTGDEVEAALPILSPVTVDRRCREALDLPTVALDTSDAGGLLTAVAGQVFSLDGSGAVAPVAPVCAGDLCTSLPHTGVRHTLGAARSPDGGTIALPTARGVLLVTGNTAKLWTGEGLTQAQKCVPADGGRRIACVSGGSALVYDAP